MQHWMFVKRECLIRILLDFARCHINWGSDTLCWTDLVVCNYYSITINLSEFALEPDVINLARLRIVVLVFVDKVDCQVMHIEKFCWLYGVLIGARRVVSYFKLLVCLGGYVVEGHP